MSELTELASADYYCQYLAHHHYENFSVASRILPAPLRVHLARIYAYCRTTDDFGDESGGDAEARLRMWRAQVLALYESGTKPVHPVLLALARSIHVLHLPVQPFLDLIDANIQDQHIKSYDDWAALHAYCMLSAAPVGRLVLRVFDVTDARAESLSDDVCIGLQLANFAQDVAVDKRKGRSYLIGSEQREHGFEGAVRTLCDRAEVLLESGRALEAMAPARLRLQLALYRLGGGAIIAATRQAEYGTDRFRPKVSRLEKLRLVQVALMQTVKGSESVPARVTAGRRS